jgi:hypothetical protein
MRTICAKLAAAIVVVLAPLTCRADAYEPGIAWVYDSADSLYTIRMVEDHKCLFALFLRSSKIGDAGYCRFLVEGQSIIVDLTMNGVFPNGLAMTDLKQLRLTYSADRNNLTRADPPMTFTRIPNAQALSLIENVK